VVPRTEPFSKCILELEVTSNEWRFTQFLTDLRDRNKRVITDNGKRWFGFAFSSSTMNDSYINLFLPNTKYKRDESDKIRVRLGKDVVEHLTKQQAKEYRNQYLVLQLVFRGILVEKGIFTELWHADQVLKAEPRSNGAEDSEDDEINEFEDIDKVLEESAAQEKRGQSKDHRSQEKKAGSKAQRKPKEDVDNEEYATTQTTQKFKNLLKKQNVREGVNQERKSPKRTWRK
jgi:hypothetical protein